MSPMESARGRAVVVQPDEGALVVAAAARERPCRSEARAGRDRLRHPFDGVSDDRSGGAGSAPTRTATRSSSRSASVGAGTRSRTASAIPSSRGPACFLGPDVKHEIVNESADEDLVMMWLISPAGLEDFFRTIGRPRTPRRGGPRPVRAPVPGGGHRAGGRNERHHHRPVGAARPRSPIGVPLSLHESDHS